jgi:hypothetical protein
MLAKMLYDLQSPLSATYGKLNILTGSRSDFITTYAAPAITQALVTANIAAVTNYLPATQVNSGELLGASVATATSTTVRTFCVNLISALGSLAKHFYLPLFAMTSAPIRLDITLVDSLAKLCACTSTAGSINITNLQFVAQFVELNDSAMAELISQLPSES